MSGSSIIKYKKTAGNSSTVSSFTTYRRPTVSSFKSASESVGYYSMDINWSGVFSKTNLYWNTTNNFNTEVDNSLEFTTETSTTVSNLLPETVYFFKLITFGTNGFIGDVSSISMSTANLPVINSISATTIDTTEMSVSYSGVFTSVNITYSDSVNFDNSLGDVTINGISTNFYNITGLNSNTTYYIKVLPFGLDSYVGEYSSTASTKTNYNPLITSFNATSVSRTSLLLEWTGLFNNVDIQYDISDTFLENPTTISYITNSYYTLTDLSSSTQYYIRFLPYRNTVFGDYSTAISTTTLSADTSSSYINTYVSGVDNSNITVVWDATYFSADLHLNLTGIFNNDNDTIVSNLSGISSYTFTNLSSNTEYFIKATPYVSYGIVSFNQYISAFTTPSITSITALNNTSASIDISFDGAYDTVDILYNETGIFDVSDMSSVGLTASPTTINGLITNTLYYFRIIPYSTLGTAGMPSDVINQSTKPEIISVSSDVIDNSSVMVYWSGSGDTVDVIYNNTGIFDISDSSINSISISNDSELITGLSSSTKYHFKVKPYSSIGGYGNYSTDTSAITLYTPTISSITGSVIDNSAVVLAWDGSFDLVDIEWDLSETFTSLVGSLTDVSLNGYTVTGLSELTEYYFKIIPKAITYSGKPSTVISKTTLYTPIVSSLTTAQIKPTSVLVNWTGSSYSAVNISWGLTNGFTQSVGSVIDISNVTSYTVNSLSPSTVYYFAIIPKETRGYGGGFYNGTKITTSVSTTYISTISTITASNIDNSAVSVGWSGTYSTVDLLYNKTGLFTSVYSSKTGLTGTSTTVAGLDSNTKYYFTVRPYSNTGYVGTDSSMANITTYYTPSISKFLGYVYDSSSILLSWVGTFSSVNILWDVSNVNIKTNSAVSGLTGNTTTITGIKNAGDYNFSIVPINYGVQGNVNAITISKTNYTPIINSIYANSTSISSIMVEWVGNYTNVSIQYNESGNFTNPYTTISGIASSVYTVTGLSSSTTYYFRILPYYDTTMGTYSSIVSASTNSPSRSYKVFKSPEPSYDTFISQNKRLGGLLVSSSSGKYVFTLDMTSYIPLLSSDYGVTWTPMLLPPEIYPSSTTVGISPSGKYLLYATYVNGSSSGQPLITAIYKSKTMYFYYSSNYGNSWEEFPYNPIYNFSGANDNDNSYAGQYTKLRINDSGECLIGLTFSSGYPVPINHYIFYTKDYGTTIQILTNNYAAGFSAVSLFECNETMTKCVYMDSSANLYEITAPFSSSTKTLIEGGPFTYHRDMVMSGDGSTIIIGGQSGNSMFLKLYKYSGSKWSFIRTITGTYGVINFESVHINYDASRIIFKYNGTSLYASYNNLLTYSHYYTPGSFYGTNFCSPSRNDNMFIIIASSTTHDIVTTNNFATITNIYPPSGFGGNEIPNKLSCSSDYKYIYLGCIIIKNYSNADRSRLLYSNDYGETFISLNSSLTIIAPTINYLYGITACSSTGEIVYLAVQHRTTNITSILKSTNRGSTWTSILGNLGNYMNILECDPTGNLVLTSYTCSINGGATWINFNGGTSGMPYPFSPPLNGNSCKVVSNTSFITYNIFYGILSSTYNFTTQKFVHTVLSLFDIRTLNGGSGLVSFCCSSDAKYVYLLTKGGSNGKVISLFKSINYGNSFSEVFYDSVNTSIYSGNYFSYYSNYNVLCSDDGATVFYSYSFNYYATGYWNGMSKDYGVTFNKKIQVGGFNTISPSTYMSLSRDGNNYSFNNLVVYSPNVNAASTSYISSYISDTSANNTTVNWDPSYSKIDIYRNNTNLFDISDTILLGITSTTKQLISGLSPNTKYYFKITPYISGVESTNQYTNITTLATITSLTTSISDTSSVNLVWDGSFTTVSIYYNTTGTSSASDTSLSSITAKTQTINNLVSNTLYYFRIIPVSSASTNGTVSSIVSKITTPSITASSTSITGLTTINVSITGLYAYYNLKWNATGIFDISDNTATNITTSTYSVTGLNIETLYYFKVTPVGTSGIIGITSDVFSATTPYSPKITDISCYTVNNSSVVVSWDGSFNNVNIYWDLSGTFTNIVGSKTTVSGNSNTITGLSGNTLYYFKIAPKYDAFTGTTSSNVSTTTYYNPVLSTLTSTTSSTSQINLVWDGSFTGVLLKYNTTNVFDTSSAVYTTLTFTTETAYSLTGLLPTTIYYFRAVPQGTTGFNSITAYNTNSTTDYLPVLADISAVAIDTSSVTITISGLYENANIEYNDTGVYTNSYNTISTTTGSTVINGLVKEKYYYFRVKPVGLRGLTGTYTTTKSVKTLYIPIINYVVYLTLSKSEISLDYDGSFTSISIVYDTSSSFAVSPTTVSGITMSSYVLSGLQNNTKYYMKVLPYVLTVSGEYTAVSSATTNKAAAADYDPYLLFDVNFAKSNLVGGVVKENISGSLSGFLGTGVITADKYLYINSTSNNYSYCGYSLVKALTTYDNFITCSLWINLVVYNSQTILHFEQPWSDINIVKCIDFNITSTGVLQYAETYGGVGGGVFTWTATGVIPLNSWTHIVLCMDATNAIPYFYINGVYYPIVAVNTSTYNSAKSSRISGTFNKNLLGVYVGVGGNCYINNVKIYKTTSVINLAGINAIMSDGAIYSSSSTAPLLYYPFDGDFNDYSAGTAVSTATIYSADLYNQTSFSTNSVCGTFSLSLDRLYTQYIKLSNISLDTSGLTIYGWANTTQTSDNSTIIQLSNGNTTIYLCCVSGIVKLIVKNSSNVVIATINTGISTSVLFTGTWFHYAITISYGGTLGASSTYTLYINGNYYTSSTAAYPIQGLYSTNYIGYNSSTATYTSLLCDSLGIYAYPLTSAQITALYTIRSTKKDSVNNKLVYYYKFISKDISGNTYLKNYGVTNGYDGSTLTTSAAYSTVSKFNIVGRGSLRCSSTTYINHKNFKPFSGEGMTCAFWLKIDANSVGSGNINPIALFGGNSGSAFLVELNINTTTGYLQSPPFSYVYNNGYISFDSATPTVPTGKTYNFLNWTHVCYVFYPNFAVVYINGVPYKKAFNWAGWGLYTGSSSCIGSGGSSYFTGNMDDIRIYNASLSQTDVITLYNYDGSTELL